MTRTVTRTVEAETRRRLEGEEASGDAASGDAASGDAASGDAASGDAASGDAASGDAASGDAASGDAASGDAASGDAAEEVTEPETITETLPKRFVGQQGLSLRRFNKSSWHHTYHYRDRMDKSEEWKDLLAMHFEIQETATTDYMANLFRGWFTPPATGNYRFHQSCDDHCDLRIGNTPDQETDVTEILNIDHWSEFRRVSYTTHGNADRISDWIPLEAGRKYYIEAAHLNGGGGDHFSTGVEIE
jgi:hypothetical protein